MRVHEFIRQRRRELGMTQAELGARVGTSQGKVGDWERGDSSPSLASLEALASVLGPITITPLPIINKVKGA